MKIIDEPGVDKLIQLPRLAIDFVKRRKRAVRAIRFDPIRFIDFLASLTIDLRVIEAEL